MKIEVMLNIREQDKVEYICHQHKYSQSLGRIMEALREYILKREVKILKFLQGLTGIYQENIGVICMEKLSMLSVNKAAGLKYGCSCGRQHTVDIADIHVEKGALRKLPQILGGFKGNKLFIVADRNTFEAAGFSIKEILSEDFSVKEYVFEDKHFIPDEKALGRLMVEIDKDSELLLAVGSGSINDTTRYISYKLNIPYVSIATAPSMDGYASVVSPLIIGGVKNTYNAVYAKSIIGDLDILGAAPMNMLSAGFGDILGKYTALADWKLSQLLNNEYYCNETVELVSKLVERCVNISDSINKRELDCIESLIEALLLSGIAIGMVGASRPASGEEHHLSHCWEMKLMRDKSEDGWLHGNLVGVGVGVVCHAYRFLQDIDINKLYSEKTYLNLTREVWIEGIEAAYEDNSKDIIEFKLEHIPLNPEIRSKNMLNIIGQWNEILSISRSLPDPEFLIGKLKNCGAVYNPKDLGFDREYFKSSIIGAKDIRNRYGVFQLLEDIGMLEEVAEHIASLYYTK